MKNLPWKRSVAAAAAIGLCICAAFATVLPKAMMDYPCFTFYDAANQCVTKGGYMSDEDTDENQILSYQRLYSPRCRIIYCVQTYATSSEDGNLQRLTQAYFNIRL